MTDRIRQIIKQHGRMPTDVDALPDDADLFLAGLSSHASVNVMLGLENAFDVEFPDEMLTRNTFASIAAIRTALEHLSGEAAA